MRKYVSVDYVNVYIHLIATMFHVNVAQHTAIKSKNHWRYGYESKENPNRLCGNWNESYE